MVEFMEKISAFVFDVDGLLLDSELVYEEAWRVAAKKMNISQIQEVHKKCLGLSQTDAFELMTNFYGKDFDAQFFWKYTSDWSADYMNEKGVPLKKGTKEILSYIKSKNIKTAVATSSHKNFAQNLLVKSSLEPYFDVVVFGDQVKHSKPDPEIYRLSCEKLGIDPSECVALEDSPNGIKSAYAAGLKCVMIPDRISADKEMEEICWKIFDSLLDFKDFLSKNG